MEPARGLLLPLAFALSLAALGALPAAGRHPPLVAAFLGAAASLVAWSAILLVTASRAGRRLGLHVVLRPQHYVQACAQLSIFVYWGWYWRDVYDAAPLIVAQLVFAYAFDLLLTWSRRDHYTLGFGPFPIIFSINLFMWFRPDWFYLQFLMVAVGFGVKELIRWNRDGRRVHIFNPSSFPLGLCSLVLLLTGTTHLTSGVDISITQLYPPHIYLVIFLVSLPAQFLFGVASMTLSAVTTTYAFMLLHTAATGEPFFPYLPIAVFLGMHLLFNDPSTSPRTESGRLVFGVLYGLSVVALFAVLERAGLPTHYDKLLAVPVLNLMIRGIDGVVRSTPFWRADRAPRLRPRAQRLAYMALWLAVFVVMQQQTQGQIVLARGGSLVSQGRIEEAISYYRELVRSGPEDVQGHIHNNLGYALLIAGRVEDALGPLQRARALQPANPQVHNNLGLVHFSAGRWEEAVGSLRRAVELQPDYQEAHANLARALTTTGDPDGALREFRAALRLEPDSSAVLTDLAFLLATHPDAAGRDAEEAVRLASRAVDLSSQADPLALDALAAAYAAGGRFDEAIRTAEAAEALAAAASPGVAAPISERLELYRAGQAPVAPGFD